MEDLFIKNSYYLLRNLQNEQWKVDWKTFLLVFALAEHENTIADLLKKWPFFRHYKDISPRLPPLTTFNVITEEIGPKNSKILAATTKGRYIAAFLFYLLGFENQDFTLFPSLEQKLPELPGFETVHDTFESIKIIKSQLPALLEYIPTIQEKFEEMNWKIDYKVILIPLYLLDKEDQCYTDLIQDYPQFGYYRELKQRVTPLVSLGLVKEEKSGRKGTLLCLTKKGKFFLIFLAYLLNFPNFPD